jgi:hypothetical protein
MWKCQWILASIFSEAKRPEREAHLSLSSNAKVKHEWSYTSSCPYDFIEYTVSGYESWTVALREEHRQSVFGNRNLRRIFVPKRK